MGCMRFVPRLMMSGLLRFRSSYREGKMGKEGRGDDLAFVLIK